MSQVGTNDFYLLYWKHMLKPEQPRLKRIVNLKAGTFNQTERTGEICSDCQKKKFHLKDRKILYMG